MEFRRNVRQPPAPPGQIAFGNGSPVKIAEGGLSEEQLMMCHYEVPGYSLAWKRWGLFRVDHIREVDYNDQAFGKLVFPEKKKKMIRLLVEQQDIQGGSFDDHIKGKGRGVIFLLHGPPGVGKTFTAGNYLLACNSGQTLISRQRV